MPTLLDLLYVALFAVGLPLYGYFVFTPHFQRQVAAAPKAARWSLWKSSIVELWAIVGVGAALWVWFDRPWSDLKFTVPEGWQMWVAVVLIVAYVIYMLLGIAQIRGNAAERARVRASFDGDVEHVLPRTRNEAGMFVAVSWTAGFCEEFLYRGYFIWALAPWLGWWGAAGVSLSCFAIGHIYQGWSGVLKTAIFGAIYTGLVWLTDSLWPAIAWHFLVDALNGVAAWIVLREHAPPAAAESEGDRDDLRSYPNWVSTYPKWVTRPPARVPALLAPGRGSPKPCSPPASVGSWGSCSASRIGASSPRN